MLAHSFERSTGRGLLLGLAALMTAAALAFGSAAPAGAVDAAQMRIGTVGATHALNVGLNKSVIVDLPTDASEVIVSQPGIAQTIMRTKRRAIIQGASTGSTNIFFLDGAGEPISVLDVTVVDSSSGAADAMGLQTTLARIIPGSRIVVATFDDRVVLSGTVQSADDLQKALAIAGQFTGNPDAIANVITVGGIQQVMLKVTVAEVARETVRQLGINLSGSVTIGTSTLSLASQNALGGASGLATNNGVGLGINTGTFSLNAMLRALERRGSLRTLASPTLTAMSGTEAEFLAGGQFPVPSGVDDGTISFEFKQFGVNLKFTPTVKSNGIIGLAVDTSVSEPTTEGGFTLQGVTIPATRNRQARTTVELPVGCTLAIAGLFEDEVRQQINQMPGMGDIPILGALFRSRDYVRSQTELVIMVTPYLAEPGRPELPTEEFAIPNDAEAIFLGRMERNYSVGDGDNFRGGFDGAVGFVLD
jgi:pilus assembly protein CpaC